MKALVLAAALDAVADECDRADIPDDPFERDALYHAAMGASQQTLRLAKRVAETQRAGRWRRRQT